MRLQALNKTSKIDVDLIVRGKKTRKKKTDRPFKFCLKNERENGNVLKVIRLLMLSWRGPIVEDGHY